MDETKNIPFQLQKLFLLLQSSDKSSLETTDLTASFGWQSSEAYDQHDVQVRTGHSMRDHRILGHAIHNNFVQNLILLLNHLLLKHELCTPKTRPNYLIS